MDQLLRQNNLGQKPRVFSELTSTEGVSSYYCAGDAKLLEGSHTQRTAEVTGWPDVLLRSRDGDSGFTGCQYHDHGFDVWDGETRFLPEAPDTQTG